MIWKTSQNILQLEQKSNWMKLKKGITIFKIEVVKAIKDMRRKKVTGNENIPVDFLKEMGDSGLKIMTALVNKIYMSGD
jgi:hypothetical protein